MVNPKAVDDAQGEWVELFNPNAAAMRLEVIALNVELHEQFHHIEISGVATGIPSFQIVSWVRPEPIRYDLAALRRVIGTSNMFVGKTVLVTGGSRGFGSVLARGFALFLALFCTLPC